MTTVAVRADALSKRYRIAGARSHNSYRSLRDSLVETVQEPWRRLRHGVEPKFVRDLWALQDISFEVQHGEVVGIIGRNGAGKSTLLKLLSRITEPTRGRAEVRGRVGSLLEVGTGFHPELTGRDNIFLNGAILGMPKAHIQRKFDEIVAFAEIEDFLETPVKRYSSGMYMRLAFSVAAHLEPDVLVVDEVLAVGDAAFQKKCLGKMAAVAGEGRTVLFVSHNMPAVTRLCSRALLLEEGTLLNDGPAGHVAAAYLDRMTQAGATRTWSSSRAPGTDDLQLRSVVLLKDDGTPASVAKVSDQLRLRVAYRVLKPGLRFRCVGMVQTQGVYAFTTMELSETVHDDLGDYCAEVVIPPHLLSEGEYLIGVALMTSRGLKQSLARVNDAISFQVVDPMTAPSARGDYAEAFTGVLRPWLHWTRWRDR